MRRVGARTTVNTSNDPWLLDFRQPCIQTKSTGIDDLNMMADLMIERRWNYELIRAKFNERDAICILQVPLSHTIRRDEWFWKHNRSG